MYTVSNKGHISKGIRISYGIEADEEPDACAPFCDEDDTNTHSEAAAVEDSFRSRHSSTASSASDDGLQVRGDTAKTSHQQQQQQYRAQDNAKSIQEARLFAAHMLNESERRVNLHSEHTLSMKQESSSTLRQFMTKATSSRRFYDEISLVEEPNTIRSHDPKRFRRTTCCRLLAVVAALAAVITFSVLAIDAIPSNKTESVGTPETDGRMDATIAYLFEQEISSAKDLYDESTAQYQAARWMALEDPEQLTVPTVTGGGGGGLRNTNSFRFVQRYVLSVLFFALNGDGWDNRHNFVTGVHECSWFDSNVNRNDETYALGVTCNQNLQVRNLLLRKFVSVIAHRFLHFTPFTASNGLHGTIPPEIQHLSKLDFLDLQDNALTGSLPTDLQALTLLKFLDLNMNQLTGSIPHWLGESLEQLQVLGLSDNLLVGSIPGSLATGLAANLNTLSLDGNMLTGDLTTLQRLRYLEFLYLNDNNFEGRLDHGLLMDMPHLLEVDLSSNQLSNEIPDYLFRMSSLKVLDVSNNLLTGSLPSEVGRSANGASALKFASFRNNTLTKSIPASLMTHLSGLTHFDVSFNGLTGDCPSAIGDMTDLSYLFLSDNHLSMVGGTIPEHLQSLTLLRELSLGNLELQGSIPTWLDNFKDLRLLDFAQNQLT
ncbi:MAG: hypothetical protein SGARI_002188, partial [Bacillariaceae sp.]